MAAAIWSFLLGWVALYWGVASIYLPTRVIQTLDGAETDPSRAIVAIVPVVIMTLVIGGLVWFVVKRVKAPPNWKVGVSRGLGFSGLALSLIGLLIAAAFSPIWGGL